MGGRLRGLPRRAGGGRLKIPPPRRALLTGGLLGAFLLVLAVFAAATWCDAERFGLFLQASPAPEGVPAVEFTVADETAYPDVHRALRSLGYPVRAEDPESARAWLDRMAREEAVAVRVEQGPFYLAGYEQTPSETWTAICG